MQFEPGLDRHEWEGEWQGLAEELDDAPEDVLPDAADLLERMLLESGYDLADPVAREGEEREIMAEFLAAREIAKRVEAGETVDPGDLGNAVQSLVTLHDRLIEPAP